MSKFIRGIVILAFPSVLGVIGTIAPPAFGSPACMTQEEARKAFPHDHIYWHGKEHCWHNAGKRDQKPVAHANVAEVSASSDIGRLDDKPLGKQEPAVEKASERVVIPPVSFIDDDLRRGLVWPVVVSSANDMPANDVAADAQQDDPLPSPSEPKEDVVIGAPNAAPGSPDYLLEHCCWPPLPLNRVNDSVHLPQMVMASTSGCVVAIGLWLLIHRRRQQRTWVSERSGGAHGRHPRQRRISRNATFFD